LVEEQVVVATEAVVPAEVVPAEVVPAKIVPVEVASFAEEVAKFVVEELWPSTPTA
jgi:hypothetical protein